MNNKLPKYDNYKHSNVEWLGDIPQHWEVKPGFTILSESKERNNGLKEKTVLSLSYGKVIIKPEEKLTGLVPESFETYQLVSVGDIIIRPTDLQNDKTSLRTGLAKNKGIITSAYVNLRVKIDYSNSFYHYYLHTIDLNKVIYGLGSGLRQNISFLDFKRFPFPIPPLSEQEKIAQFLDEKTTKIDKAIEIKQRQIELLKERRQILIHRAVTRGVGSLSGVETPLKDSGIEWIGEIPEHWEVKKLKYVSDIVYGISPNEKTYNDIGEGTVLINGPVEYSEEDFGYSRSLKWTTSPVKFAKKGSLLFCLRGSTTGRLNICHSDVAIGRGCAAILGRQNHDFLIKAIVALKDRIVETFKGSTFPSVTSSDLDNYFVPIPPIEEQIAISEYLENISAKISKAIGLKEREIEVLKEYKSSLINSAVTGKVKIG